MEFVEFLKEAAPLFGLHWRPFQRRGVKRKIERRIIEIELSHFDEYLVRVRKDPEEQRHLSQILTVTISRFYRDKEVFNLLGTSIIPRIIKNKKERGELKIWSIGCANGEEPYSLSVLWKQKFEKTLPKIRLTIFATDINDNLLERAKEGRYKKSSLKEVPEEILQRFFKMENGFYILDRSIRKSVEFRRHDIIHEEPFSRMDMVFCRNLAFTYFTRETQIRVLKKFFSSLKDDGHLVIGWDESLPLTYPTLFIPAHPKEKIYQKFNSLHLPPLPGESVS
jgi:chemotaxis methyl-accepting protein methylase